MTIGPTAPPPDSGSTLTRSRGVAATGDLDGDGKADIAISSILANPGTGGIVRTHAGEVYILYGRGDR